MDKSMKKLITIALLMIAAACFIINTLEAQEKLTESQLAVQNSVIKLITLAY